MVFFFKQKTAYEMRISDWSSDVCSSDQHADDAGIEAAAVDIAQPVFTRWQFERRLVGGKCGDAQAAFRCVRGKSEIELSQCFEKAIGVHDRILGAGSALSLNLSS